jgi:hypothetical protein
VLREIEVPVKRQVPRAEGEEEQQVEKSTLLVRTLSSFISFTLLTIYRLW